MKEAKPVARIDLSTMSDLDELVLCRSANQINVCVYCLSLLISIYPYRLQETMKEYENIASANLLETIKMEFSELKAEAYSSLSMCYWQSCNIYFMYNEPFSVEILVEPSVYFAQELDEAIQVSKKDGIMI